MNRLEFSKALGRLKAMKKEIEDEARIAQEKELELKRELQVKINDLLQPLRNKAEILKAEQKKLFGVCEGENIDIFNTIDMFMKVTSIEP